MNHLIYFEIGIKSNLATLKVKFLESRSKMDARRLKKGRNEPLPSTGLEVKKIYKLTLKIYWFSVYEHACILHKA